jgi:hypothetical protein
MFAVMGNILWRAHRPHSAVAAGGGAAPAMDAPAPGEGRRADTAEMRQPPAGVLDELSNALSSARVTVSNFLDLVSLETRRAGLTLMWMCLWGLVAAVLIVTAWMGLMVALAMSTVLLGVPPIVAVFVVAVINLICGAVVIRVCMGLSRNLLFAATRRQVGGTFAVKSTAP